MSDPKPWVCGGQETVFFQRDGSVVTFWGVFQGVDRIALVKDAGHARLMASANDLLAALKKVVAIADRKTVEFDEARAAIAKAERAS